MFQSPNGVQIDLKRKCTKIDYGKLFQSPNGVQIDLKKQLPENLPEQGVSITKRCTD